MLEPQFKIGDVITFELTDCNGQGGYDSPRWDFTQDRGGSGKWAIGKVTDITADEINIEATGIMGVWGWIWPNKADSEYAAEQWNRPGYLRHAKKYNAQFNKQVEITIHGTNI